MTEKSAARPLVGYSQEYLGFSFFFFSESDDQIHCAKYERRAPNMEIKVVFNSAESGPDIEDSQSYHQQSLKSLLKQFQEIWHVSVAQAIIIVESIL